jgi:glucose dehydrogenase
LLKAHTARVKPLVLAVVLAGLLATVESAHTATEADAGDVGNWTMPARDYASTRFSPLDQVTTANVKSLTLAWTFSTGVLRGHEAAPLIVDDTLYIVTPYPNIVYALDLRQPGAPVKWKFSPKPASSSIGVA